MNQMNDMFTSPIIGCSVLNPITDETLKIPPPDLQRPTFYGLATSPKGFKIVCICASSLASIYSSYTSSWMPLDIEDSILERLMDSLNRCKSKFLDLNRPGAAFASQSLHWLLDDGEIVVLDVKKRLWRVMESTALGKITVIEAVDEDLSMRACRSWQDKVELADKLQCCKYPNVWFGSVGAHLYLVMVVNEKDLQLWMLENYDKEEWKMIVEIRDSELIVPLFFDGRRIHVAVFEGWRYDMFSVRSFDTITRKWQRADFMIDGPTDNTRFFFPCFRE